MSTLCMNTYGLPNITTFIAFAKFSHCKRPVNTAIGGQRGKENVRHCLSFRTRNLRLGPVQHLLELGDAMAHAGLHIRF
jgi:hypothetical protein